MMVRRAAASDAPFIAAAERSYIDCPWTCEQICDEISDARTDFFVAEHDGAFAGYVSAKTVLDECEFGNIAVAENMRRRGVARALMSELLNALEANGVSKVFLEVRSDNTAAISLYERFGFVRVRVRKGYYNGKDAIVMSKSM